MGGPPSLNYGTQSTGLLAASSQPQALAARGVGGLYSPNLATQRPVS